MCQGKILVIDDEQYIRRLVQSEFAPEGFEVFTAKNGEEGLKLFENQRFELVLLDIRLPRTNGIEILKILKREYPQTQVIMITGHGDIKTAVESMKLGARDYITKPFKLSELLAMIKQVVHDNQEMVSHGFDSGPTKTKDFSHYVHCPSRPMQEVYKLVEKVAPTDKMILIVGETGTGKDLLAHQIHLQSLRKNGPFTTVDCGLLTHNLAESELYGHAKGAFSGATEKKIGLVEKSHGGTLFLDEIGNIDPDLQKKFLRFLETGRIRRVGEIKENLVDTRIVLATNLPIEAAVEQGKIRADLFYRMALFSITIPSLRKRPEDILPLARHFLTIRTKDTLLKKISPEAAEIMISYPWPGNIRELKSAINRICIMTDAEIITRDHLPPHFRMQKGVPSHASKNLEDIEKEHILRVLADSGGNQSQAAQVLGINRKTLYKKINKYQIFS
jgi:DNA-binding NtrC family response regulator